jgi:hypothetical protein
MVSNVIPEIYEVKEKMKNFSSEIISGNKKDIQENLH